LNYSISDILKEYPHLERNIILTLLKIGKDANENLMNVDIDDIISKEVKFLKILLDENVPILIIDVIHDLGFNVFTLHDFNMLGIQNGDVKRKYLIFAILTFGYFTKT